jgi:NTP pyrophosphatase (non-canonical NTP hydrolase)
MKNETVNNTQEARSSAAHGSENAAAEAVGEVVRATNKFPTWPTDPIHALAVLQEEVGELTKEVVQLTYEPHKSTLEAVRREAVQTAAMALRFLMSLDRYEFMAGQQHSQNE